MGEIELLNKAFSSFEEASRLLEENYRELEAEIRSLRLQVEEKNTALEASLSETERGRLFLDKVLEGIPTGVVVFSPQGQVLKWNSMARRFLGEERDVRTVFDLPFDLTDAEAVMQDSAGRNITTMLSHSGMGDIGSVLIMQDITRIKELERQAELNRRLAAMGELVAKIAHEIRNPLGSIELFASMLSNDLEDTRLKDLADGISTGVKSLVNTLNNMLMYTRTKRINRVPVDLVQVVRESSDFIGVLAQRNGVELYMDLDEGDSRILGDRELVRQALYNLSINGIQAMERGGNLHIRLHESGTDYIKISIRDTGPGIPKDHVQRIFDPFFSTKDRGNGLGLSIVRSVMKDHDGSVNVTSEPGVGTEFVLTFPRYTEEPE